MSTRAQDGTTPSSGTPASPAEARPAAPRSAARAADAGGSALLVSERPATPRWLSWLLIVTGALGLFAAWSLSVEKISMLENPGQALACDINPFLQCTVAIESWQGSLFGFPNPFLGMMCFVAPIAVGVATLAGARFSRWFWIAFVAGVFLGLVLVLWLAGQALFVMFAVCPWCYLVWTVMYAMFWPLVISTTADGHLGIGGGLQRLAKRLVPWSWVISVAMVVIVALLIMIQIPEIPRFLFR